MRGAIPPLPSTFSWCGAKLSTGTTLPFTFTIFDSAVEDNINPSGKKVDVSVVHAAKYTGYIQSYRNSLFKPLNVNFCY
jgi:hypothetical protein